MRASYAASPMSGPEVSVVIPSRGRRETRVAFTLEALEAQTLAPDRFEVVIVRDPDSGLPTAIPPKGLTVRQLTAERPSGPAHKRNLGWRAAAGHLVAFTDDDCRPAPGWLEALLSAAGGREDAIVQGRTLPDPDELHLLWGLSRSVTVEGESDHYETCNIAYPRALVERVGGFDEGFGDVGGEDVDIALRAQQAGAKRVYAPDALVWHAVHVRRLPGAVREATRWVDLPYLLARHPSQRAAYDAGLFLYPSHWQLLLALAGLAARKPLVALAAALPYLRRVLSQHGRSPLALAGGLAELPAQALVDATEIATVLRGSLRHRTLFL